MGSYVTGWSGTVRDLAGLQAWSHWQHLDPEYQRRALAIMDAAALSGRPLGIGEIFRSFAQQQSTFLSRHHVVASGGCCGYDGKRWALNSGVAHAAPPGLSYHEATTPDGKALAIDFSGNLAFLAAHAAEYGLVEFTNIGNEPWHGQPFELPHGRSRYVAATMHPLFRFVLPGTSPQAPPPPPPAPTKLFAPLAVLRVGKANDLVQAKAFQFACNFWGWRDANNRTLLVDGDYGQKTAQACISMQRSLKLYVDGVYGAKSQAGLQAFLDFMVSLNG